MKFHPKAVFKEFANPTSTHVGQRSASSKGLQAVVDVLDDHRVLDGNNLAFVYLVDGCRSRGSHRDVLNEPIFVELSSCYVVFRTFSSYGKSRGLTISGSRQQVEGKNEASIATLVNRAMSVVREEYETQGVSSRPKFMVFLIDHYSS
jgi:hypothetical protein